MRNKDPLTERIGGADGAIRASQSTLYPFNRQLTWAGSRRHAYYFLYSEASRELTVGTLAKHSRTSLPQVACDYVRPNTPPEFTYREALEWLLGVLAFEGVLGPTSDQGGDQ